MVKKIFVALIILLVTNFAYAQEEVKFPHFRGYVNDFANIISAEDKRSIETLAQELDKKATAQIAVVTVASTKPLTIEQYAVELFEKWGVGKKYKDNGVLVLMAVDDREIRIETGYGLEGAVPDIIANQIINQVMIPQFKQGKLSKGLLSGVISISRLIAKEYNVKVSTPPESGLALPQILIIIIFLILYLKLVYHLRGKRGRWYGSSGYYGGSGSFGGSFGGFGGGLSGGGGATGRW